MMKLIGSATSPYVRKVRIVMAEKKLDYQFVLEDVWAATTAISLSNPLAIVLRRAAANPEEGVLDDEGFASLGIDPGIRPENLPVGGFVAICNYLTAQPGSAG